MIFVTGATGNIGKTLAEILAAQGVRARTLHRKPEDGERLAALGHEPAKADLHDEDELQRAMRGCDTLFLLPPPLPAQEDLELKMIEAAKAAGLSRVLKVSAGDACVSSRVPWAKAHAMGELALRRSGLRWTVLRPSAFYQNFLQLAAPMRRGVLPIAAGQGHAAYVDARDVAAVAARLLTGEGHGSATYFLTGPEALSMGEIARILSAALERRVRYIDLPVPLYRASLRLAGLDRWLANGLVAQYAGVVSGGHDIAVTDDVRRLSGQEPRSFASFAQEHRQALA